MTLRAIVAGVFAWAGLVKVGEPGQFQAAVDGYRLLPLSLTFIVAAYLPWLEISVAACLWVSRLKRGAEWVALGLTVIFMAALLSAWIRGLDVECGCFGGTSTSQGYWWPIGRDLALGLATASLLSRSRNTRLPARPATSSRAALRD